MGEIDKPGIAILASGSGSTAEAFIHATQDGRVDAEVGLVVCNNPPEKAGIYTRIEQLNNQYGLGIETMEISSRTHPQGNVGRGQTLAESTAICQEVSKRNLAHVALMGYLKIIRGDLIEEYGWKQSHNSIYEARMINTHPGPLPETEDTYGIFASQRVLELGMVQSLHTVHLVTEGIDRGPKLAEHPVDIIDGDTPQSLFERVQSVEKPNLPNDINAFLHNQAYYLAKSHS